MSGKLVLKIKNKIRNIIGTTELLRDVEDGFDRKLDDKLALFEKNFEEKLDAKLAYFDNLSNQRLEILYQREKGDAEVRKGELYSEMSRHFEENSKYQRHIFDRVAAAEQNLNYYGMIDSIRSEYKYTTLELMRLPNVTKGGKRILLAGFYGADNLGDELMLQSIINAFPKEKQRDITVMLFDNDAYDYSHLPAVNFMHLPKNKFDYNMLADKFDVLIWGGGALIDDAFYADGSVCLNNMIVDLSLRFIAFDKAVYALGLSANTDLQPSDYTEKLKEVCKNSRLFSVRDTYSFDILKNLGMENLSRLEDPVLYEDMSSFKKAEKTDPKKVNIGVVWICNEDTCEKLLLLLDKLEKKFGCVNYEVYLFPFYDYLGTDRKFYESFTDNPKVRVLSYTNSLEKVAGYIGDMDYMVSMRYHGILLGAMLGKQSLNMCYDVHRHYHNKIKYLTDFFGVGEKTVSFTDFGEETELEFVSPAKVTLPERSEIEKVAKSILK